MLLSGVGVEENKAEAARFFRMAADFTEAQVSLARLLFDGDGVPQDKEEAERLYRLAADSENSDAEFELGMKFLNGDIAAGQFLSKEEKPCVLSSPRPHAGMRKRSTRLPSGS